MLHHLGDPPTNGRSEPRHLPNLCCALRDHGLSERIASPVWQPSQRVRTRLRNPERINTTNEVRKSRQPPLFISTNSFTRVTALIYQHYGLYEDCHACHPGEHHASSEQDD